MKSAALLALALLCVAGCRTGGDASLTATAPSEAGVEVPCRAVPIPEGRPFADYDLNFAPPAGAETFELSQDFPSGYDETETFAWEAIDFREEPFEYMQAVYEYGLEGNIEVDFAGQRNPIRTWYHAPWLNGDGTCGGNGREYHHGMTRERNSPPFELHRDQSGHAENWAVGMYNDRGGYTLGRVWSLDDGYPDPSASAFPPNTVAFKLLFTTAPVSAVPFLEGSLEWTGNVYPDRNTKGVRRDSTLRLLQIDMAVRDPRLDDATGWVFGTFIYDASRGGATPWDNMAPVGLAWGDDSDVTAEMHRDGSFVNPALRQTVLNSELVERPDEPDPQRAYMRYFGLGSRLDGPVDNPISSCISCHGRSGTSLSDTVDGRGYPRSMANFRNTRADFPQADFDTYFAEVPHGAYRVQDAGREYMTLDYSLQLAVGIRNFYQNLRGRAVASGAAAGAEPLSAVDRSEAVHAAPQLPLPSRGE